MSKPGPRGPYKHKFDYAQLLQEWSAGDSSNTLAKRYGITRQRVSQIVIQMNGGKHDFGRRPNPFTAEIVAAYEAGETLSQVGARFGYSPRAIRLVLVKAGITRRYGRPARQRHPKADAIIADYQAGLSMSLCGKKHGLSTMTVQRLLKAENIQARPQGCYVR
jgi:hypothetical protein